MSKSQDTATHKGTGCLRAAHLLSPLAPPSRHCSDWDSGYWVCAGSGLEQTAAASSSSAGSPQGPAQCKWEVPSADSHH